MIRVRYQWTMSLCDMKDWNSILVKDEPLSVTTLRGNPWLVKMTLSDRLHDVYGNPFGMSVHNDEEHVGQQNPNGCSSRGGTDIPRGVRVLEKDWDMTPGTLDMFSPSRWCQHPSWVTTSMHERVPSFCWFQGEWSGAHWGRVVFLEGVRQCKMPTKPSSTLSSFSWMYRHHLTSGLAILTWWNDVQTKGEDLWLMFAAPIQVPDCRWFIRRLRSLGKCSCEGVTETGHTD